MKIITFAMCAVLVLGACSSTGSQKEEPFTVDLNSISFKAGGAEAYFDRYMAVGSLRKNENINVVYYPAEDAVCLQFKIQLAECNQFWDKAGREAFVKAFEQYKADYEEKKLSKGSKRSAGRTYGSTQGFFMWKKTKVGVQAHGSPKVEFGYFIKDQAAFFATAQAESNYIDPIARSRNQTSPVIRMYFTRAQAEDLIALFNEEHLRGLKTLQSVPAAPSGPDTYTELN